jgi:hypothetical protein
VVPYLVLNIFLVIGYSIQSEIEADLSNNKFGFDIFKAFPFLAKHTG